MGDVATEIEHKFLVKPEDWARLDKPEGHLILQGFLHKSKACVVRIRVLDDTGYLTIKGATQGRTRSEFEYEIPLSDAEALIDEFTDKSIHKFRYEILFDGKTWEVDVF